MSEKPADEEVQKPERNDPQVTDVPPPKPADGSEKSSSPSVTAVGKKKVVWKNNSATDVGPSSVPVAKSKIVAKVPAADLGVEGPSTGSRTGRKKISWRKNQNKTYETETKNQEHQEHQDTDVPSDTSPASRKVESGRLRTPRGEKVSWLHLGR